MPLYRILLPHSFSSNNNSKRQPKQTPQKVTIHIFEFQNSFENYLFKFYLLILVWHHTWRYSGFIPFSTQELSKVVPGGNGIVSDMQDKCLRPHSHLAQVSMVYYFMELWVRIYQLSNYSRLCAQGSCLTMYKRPYAVHIHICIFVYKHT